MSDFSHSPPDLSEIEANADTSNLGSSSCGS